nr:MULTISPECIES: hypothetical protein [unclassified Pseudomonas]
MPGSASDERLDRLVRLLGRLFGVVAVLTCVVEGARRIALAIAGSGAGIWDRNVAIGEIHYSSSWKALLGYAEHEVGNRIEESYTRVHPADLD